MTQNSNHDAYVPWGERASAPPALPLLSFMTVPALLAHIVVMLTVTSALTLVNLVTTPRVWWSLAILAIWFVLVVIHAIGLAARNLLLDEEAEAPATAPRAQAGVPGSPAPGWRSPPQRDGNGATPTSGEVPADGTPSSWPEHPTGQDAPSEPEPSLPPERVPWRAATDFAWLRRQARGADNGQDGPPPASREASS